MFVKRTPLADREVASSGCTANLFELPMFCQSGIGGTGFNAWRELADNMIVADATLAGHTPSLPNLNHWWVLPGRSPLVAEHVDIDAAVGALAGFPAVGARLEALAVAT